MVLAVTVWVLDWVLDLVTLTDGEVVVEPDTEPESVTEVVQLMVAENDCDPVTLVVTD